jgi:GT2 family glycosyltransferase
MVCLQSLAAKRSPHIRLYCVDNESDSDQLKEIKKRFSDVIFLEISKNLGFSGGYNHFFDKYLGKFNENDLVFLLNSDTKVPKATLSYLASSSFDQKRHLVACKTHLYSKIDKVENLGTLLFRSGIAANRTKASETLFSPSGGNALLSVEMLRSLKKKTGEYFDGDFFCYVEDVELGLRAIMLGYKPDYDPNIIIYHKGGSSTGGEFNDFVMIHTLRNFVLMIIKSFPSKLILLNLFWIVGFQFLILLRYIFSRRILALFKVYLGIFRLLPKMFKKRSRVQKVLSVSVRDIQGYIT